jgi:DNA repair photolyase
MPLNKQTGNMYPFVTHTWNPIRGKCPHDCLYCYMKVYPQPELHFAQKELGTNLGQGNFIFVGSSTDMWCKETLNAWIMYTLGHCKQFANRYLFQTKNPARFIKFLGTFPPDTILGTTIESDVHYGDFSKAPSPVDRFDAMMRLRAEGIPRMVSIEPIMAFHIDTIARWVTAIKPEFVSIGADSKGHNLPEPNATLTRKLIKNLRSITKVYVKDNLNRIIGAKDAELLQREMPRA